MKMGNVESYTYISYFLPNMLDGYVEDTKERRNQPQKMTFVKMKKNNIRSI